MGTQKYTVLIAKKPPDIKSVWDGVAWENVPALEISCYRPEGSAHRPITQCKLLYDQNRIYGIFRVQDQFVRCVHTGFQSEVYRDSCVEFFVQPKTTSGYFNFEFNCGGALLAYYITDPTRIGGSVKEFAPLTSEDDLQIRRYTNLPPIVEPEITRQITWFLGFSIPFAVLEKYAGALAELSGQTWRANFYKCGNETSQPHWASWSPISELNFHLPDNFGEIEFDPQ
ncbi:MAG: diguanylate cyclase [Deltaproteobacteria bacterium HGW-Deltaproteobacteria-10]|nr:MAG: diguanylate cyclase [Deltaproteobacteria bacterium HGW-Deltaproteobacteria-10]